MKFSAASLLFLVGSASAITKPKLTIRLQDGVYGDIMETLAPEISIDGSEGENLEYGGRCAVSEPGRPGSFWASLRSKVELGVGETPTFLNLFSKVEVSQGQQDFGEGEMKGVYGTVEAENEEQDLFGWASVAVGFNGNVTPLKVGAKKIVELDDEKGKVMVSPRYNVEEQFAEVVVGFEKDATQAYLTVSQDDQDLYLQHQLNDATSATAKVGKQLGFMSASVTNANELGVTTLTYTPDEVDVEIKNDGWVAGISTTAPSGLAGLLSGKGLEEQDLKVRLSKTMTFSP